MLSQREAMSSYVQLQKYDEERRKKSKVYQGIAYKDAIDLCKGTRKKENLRVGKL